VFLLVPAYLGSPGSRAVKRLCVCSMGCDFILTSVLVQGYHAVTGRTEHSEMAFQTVVHAFNGPFSGTR